MNNDIVIGKFTLESLTNGMYSSPKDLYREYIQNAVDSIDTAIDSKVIMEEDAIIRITVNSNERQIRIKDNGMGIPQNLAAKLLLDIGNSSKSRRSNRGFRGIGRLAGLGYCDELIFTTSYIGEKKKTVITFDAAKLKWLLRQSNDDNESITDVIEAVINVEYYPEKEKKHYFYVDMKGVDATAGLLEKEGVIPYFQQYLPLHFSPDFQWGDLISKKIRKTGYNIPSYRVIFSDGNKEEELFKPYSDTFISDRVKKFEKSILDVEIIPLAIHPGETAAILWYAKTDYSGTILDDLTKGIRIRQGNILIGDKSTSNQFFREDRFNGWLIGELYIIDPNFVPNARRDDFENTSEYTRLKEILLDWGTQISKDIRRVSYERNVEQSKKKAIEESDENNLIFEDMTFIGEEEEISDTYDESSIVASNELLDRFKILLGQKAGSSKYMSLNMRTDIPTDQKRVMEKVFDAILKSFDANEAERVITAIVENYN